MKNKKGIQLILILLFICTFQLPISTRAIQNSTSDYYPPWLVKGTYVVYKDISEYYGQPLYKATYAWIVTDLKIPNATIKAKIEENGIIRYNRTFIVNIITRQVYDTNNNYIGITPMWINPALLVPNNTFTLGETKYARYIGNTTWWEIEHTPQGIQDTMWVESLPTHDPIDYGMGCEYDLDTGLAIVIAGARFPLFFSNISYHFYAKIIATNINLGLPDFFYEFMDNMPLIMFGGIIAIYFIYRKIKNKLT